MRTEHILIVSCEWIAFLAWVFNYARLKEPKYRVFVFYLGFLAGTELANLLLWRSNSSPTNWIVNHVNVPVQFFFWYYFLLYKYDKNRRIVFYSFVVLYAAAYVSEQVQLFTKPVNFDSFSYGIGVLLLLSAIVIAIKDFFWSEKVARYQRETIFWMLIGLTVYYMGSFPYQLFKNYFWSDPKMYDRAYLLYYTSGGLNCIMYLFFAYSVRWKIN